MSEVKFHFNQPAGSRVITLSMAARDNAELHSDNQFRLSDTLALRGCWEFPRVWRTAPAGPPEAMGSPVPGGGGAGSPREPLLGQGGQELPGCSPPRVAKLSVLEKRPVLGLTQQASEIDPQEAPCTGRLGGELLALQRIPVSRVPGLWRPLSVDAPGRRNGLGPLPTEAAAVFREPGFPKAPEC